MTLRLVALMSVVLLLSLASFGLLMGHYQDQVMQEVARTASAVGQATVRTFEVRGGAHSAEGVVVWHTDDRAAAVRTIDEVEDTFEDRQVRQVIVAGTGDAGEGPKTVRRIERFVTTTADGDQVTVRERVTIPTGPEAAAASGDLRQQLHECLESRVETRRAGDARDPFFIAVEEIRAESDPARGLVLKIPRFTPADHEKLRADNDFQLQTSVDDATPGALPGQREEIQLPIPVEDYDAIFQTLRGRSLFLFLGVFLVGMVLSTGLASRFTRPIRRLDAGIRRLSEGDLDVTVQAHGKDEIGRLSRAFNEMAGKLRANRDRSRELVRREKLSALGRLAAGVAHDVRNPLHSIGLTLEHLNESARPREAERSTEFDRSLEIIRGEIRRLDRLVGNFLLFAKTERHRREPVALADLLQKTASLVQKEAERLKVRLKLEIDASTPPVLADAEALRSAILNLVLNSFEAMPRGGTLSVTLRAEAGEALLEVADTGEGIPEEHRERVFDFAYTTREGGNGMGLAMVHHCIVEEHGGRVSLDSRPGEGTRVRLALPCCEGTAS